MSYPVEQIVVCPNCGHEAAFTCWSSVNVSIDPEMKNELCEGRLTTFECPKCKSSCPIEYNILYHDMEGGLMVWLKYPEEDGTMNLDPTIDTLFSTMASEYVFRIVPRFWELLEKIRLFDDDLDDVSVETLKLLICMKQSIDIDAPFLYDRKDHSFLGGQTLVFVRPDSAEDAEMKYPIRHLRSVESVAQKVRQMLDVSAQRWKTVDRAAVLECLERAGLANRIG